MSANSVRFHEEKRHAVYDRDGYKCHYCGYHDQSRCGVDLSIDHIKARDRGGEGQAGKTEPGTNLITACGSCNSTKGAKTPQQFNRYLEAQGKSPADFPAIRAQARKPLDIKAGVAGAERSKLYREAVSHAEALKQGAIADAMKKYAVKLPGSEKSGPGIRHGKNGQFMAGGKARTFSKSLVDELVKHFVALHGLADLGWTFATRIVPGLAHGEPPEPAWAVIRTDPQNRRAIIDVRDLAQTPLPTADWWTELQYTIGHEIGHAQVDEYLMTDDEEGMVERIARGLVHAGATAKTFARSWWVSLNRRPEARARIWQKTIARARVLPHGGRDMGQVTMSREQAQAMADAVESGDTKKALEIIKAALVEAASSGAEDPMGAAPPLDPMAPEPVDDLAGPEPAEGREMSDEEKDKDPNKPPMARSAPSAARAREAYDAEMRANLAEIGRARKLAETTAATMVENGRALARSVISQRIFEERRMGTPIAAAHEVELAAMTDVKAFEQRMKDYKLGLAANAAPGRARTATVPAATPAEAGGGEHAAPKYTIEGLVKEGIDPAFAAVIVASDPVTAENLLAGGRARIAAPRRSVIDDEPGPATTARGGVS